MDTPNFQQLKIDVHRTLLSKMDLEKLATVNNGKAVQTISLLIEEIFGLGPLEPLLKDHTISDILVNKKDLVYVERRGILEKVNVRFRDDAHLMQIIDRIVARIGRRVDESS